MTLITTRDLTVARLKGYSNAQEISSMLCTKCLFSRTVLVQIKNTRTGKIVQFFDNICMAGRAEPSIIRFSKEQFTARQRLYRYHRHLPTRRTNLEKTFVMTSCMLKGQACFHWAAHGFLDAEDKVVRITNDCITSVMTVGIVGKPYQVTIVTQKNTPITQFGYTEHPEENAKKDKFLDNVWPYYTREARRLAERGCI